MPQNLLIPADDPATFVAIDFSWQTPEALGFDLGQLLGRQAHDPHPHHQTWWLPDSPSSATWPMLG